MDPVGNGPRSPRSPGRSQAHPLSTSTAHPDQCDPPEHITVELSVTVRSPARASRLVSLGVVVNDLA